MPLDDIEDLLRHGEAKSALSALDHLPADEALGERAALARVRALRAQERYPACRTAISDGLRDHPRSQGLRAKRALWSYCNDEFDVAITQAEAVLREDPRHEVALTAKAASLRRKGDEKAARALLSERAEARDSAMVLAELAVVLWALSERPEAIELSRRALELEPGNTKARFWLVPMLMQERRFQEARSLTAGELARRPGDVSLLASLSEIDACDLRPQEALKHCDAALAIDPANEKALLVKIQVLRVLWRLDEAAGAVEGAVHRSSSWRIQVERAWLLGFQGNFGEAHQTIDAALEGRSNEDAAWPTAVKVDLYMSADRLDKARELLHSALQTYPKAPELKPYLVLQHLQDHMPEDALHAVEVSWRAATRFRGR